MIHVIGTGGTIASLPDPDTGAVRPATSLADLLDGVPGLAAFGPRAEEIDSVNGWNVTPATMLEVAVRAQAALADDAVSGVIVTHGTDTVEETAFVCDLLVDSDKPIAFAVAMRSGAELGADGPRNLLNAARVATDPAARGLGTVLVVNDEAHAARWVRKQDSFRPNAFGSPDHGPVAIVAPSGLRVLHTPGRVAALPVPERLDRPVPIVQTYTGMEESLIEAVLEATRAAGLVLEGTGLGNVPGTAEPGIVEALAHGLDVVVATRVLSGGSGEVYGGPGGGVTLRDLGVVGSRGLSAAKARLLLMLLLAGDVPKSELLDRFAATAEALV